MHKSLSIIIILLFTFITANLNAKINTSSIKEGDIIFQESHSEQAKAIKLATHSRYSHAGIIFNYNNQFKVLEAVQPVKITDLDVFINRGINHHFVIKRLNKHESLLNKTSINRMKIIGNSYIGKNYDIYFEWSDKRIYCTELIWKIYNRALNIEVGKLQHLRDFDLSDPYVKNLMKKRYGNKIPYNELVISPESMFKSEILITVINE